MPRTSAERRSEYQREYYVKNRERKLAAVKDRYDHDSKAAYDEVYRAKRLEQFRARIASPICVDCGATEKKIVWHHRDPASKWTNVSGMYQFSESSLISELEKCDPVCYSCHWYRHHPRGGAVK